MSVARLYNYGVAILRPSPTLRHIWDASEKFMVEDLAKSGLEPEDILAFPMWAFQEKNAIAGYCFLYYGLDGKPLGSAQTGVSGVMHRVRHQPAANLTREELKKFPKYGQPGRRQIGEAATIPWIHPGWWTRKGQYYLIEGEKKAAAFAKRFGVPVIAIAGYANWRHPDPGENGLHPWLVEALTRVGVTHITIIPDGDILRHDINRGYNGLKREIEKLGIEVKLVNFSAFDPNKVDDWLVANPNCTLEQVEAWPPFDEAELLENRRQLVDEYQLLHKANAEGIVTEIYGVEYNIKRLFERHPYYTDAFRMNLDTLKLMGDYNENTTIVDTASELQNNFGILKARQGIVRSCIGAVAYARGVSPLKDWLTKSIKWDGKKRLSVWMINCLGVEDTPYNREVSKKAIVAAVARKLRPGCIVDFMTILKGAQGIGKSSAIRLLFGEENVLEYTRGSAEGRDALMIMNGTWIVSDEELGMLNKTERNKLKAFITIRKDVFRRPYAPEVSEYPRAFALWGSTNDVAFLPEDESGYRRYAVVEVRKVYFDRIARDREQLFAEAVRVILDGGYDYSNVVGTSVVAEQYVYADPLSEHLEAVLAARCESKKFVFLKGGRQYHGIRGPEICRLLEWEPSKISGYEGHRLGEAMRKLGWVKVPNMRLPWDKGTNAVWIKPLE